MCKETRQNAEPTERSAHRAAEYSIIERAMGAESHGRAKSKRLHGRDAIESETDCSGGL